MTSKITPGLTKNAGAIIELSPHNELNLLVERIDSHNKIVYPLIETKGDMKRLQNGNEKSEPIFTSNYKL